MPLALLLDAGTLRNFAACDALALLRDLCNPHPEPYWVEAVRAEIKRIAIEKDGPARTQCRYILSPTHGSWLGAPIEPPLSGQIEVFSIRLALASVRDHPLEHLGEAESIWVAYQSGGTFATDDGPAFAYAGQRLGSSCVTDTVGLLRNGVTAGCLTAEEAVEIVVQMRSEGRILRRVHPTPLTRAAFE